MSMQNFLSIERIQEIRKSQEEECLQECSKDVYDDCAEIMNKHGKKYDSARLQMENTTTCVLSNLK